MKNSLAKDKDILRVLRQKPLFSRYFILKKNNSSQNIYRYTVIISKKTQKLAVKRNLLRRRIRAVIKDNEQKICSCDFIISIKSSIFDIPPKEQREELKKALIRGKILDV
jgi:ribonuclease P protein component